MKKNKLRSITLNVKVMNLGRVKKGNQEGMLDVRSSIPSFSILLLAVSAPSRASQVSKLTLDLAKQSKNMLLKRHISP